MEAYQAGLHALALRLVRLLALALDLPASHFEAPGFFDRPMMFLRLLQYAPELSQPEEGVFGAGAHSDYGMLTLLATDENDGLQIQPRAFPLSASASDAGWMDVPARPGSLIVNLGDMLERWSNGRFLSTRHRVVSKTGRERFSIPFFFEPNFDCQVECLPTCTSPANPPRYAATTAGEYLLGRYAATHEAYGGPAQS